MLHVRDRRHLAIALIAIFVAVSVVATSIVVRCYRPSALGRSAEAAFRDAFGYNISLGPAVMSLSNEAIFNSATVSADGRDLLSAKDVAVKGLPGPLGKWRPSRVEIADVVAKVDLDAAARLEAVTVLDNLARRVDMSSLALPDSLAVAVRAHDASAEYVAPVEAFLRRRTLELTPAGGAPDADWRFTVTPEAVELSANVSAANDALVQAILREARAGVFDSAENDGQGRLTAKWNANGETLALANPSGWRLPENAIKSLGLPSPGDATHVAITSLVTNDGVVTDVEGHFDFTGNKVQSTEVARWAAFVSLTPPKDMPAQFENVRAAGDFSLHDGQVSVKPLTGSSALVWSVANGSTAPIISGPASLPRADFIANTAKLKQ